MKTLTRFLILSCVIYGCLAQGNQTTTAATTTQSTTTASTTPATTTASTTPATTTASTTPATTTAPTTTASTTTASTTAVAATTSSPAPANQYELMNSTGAVCAILMMDFTFEIPYTDSSNQSKTATFNLPARQNVNVTGDCSTAAKRNATVNLAFNGNTYRLALVFVQTGSNAELSSARLEFVYDATNFPNASNPGTQSSVANLAMDMELSPVTGYYICKSEQPIPMSPGATIMASNVEIQVFGVVDGKFTGEGLPCSADVPSTTTAAPTTPAPPAKPEVHTYSYTDPSSGVVCLLLNGGVRFTIEYMTTENKTSNFVADLPNGTVTGSCSNITDVLNVAFRTDWMFSMTFNKDGGNAALDAVTLSYDTTNFPNVRDPGPFSASGSGLNMFKAGTNQFYSCSTVELKRNATTFDFNSLQVQAFRTSNSTDFAGSTALKCPADEGLSNIVPIAVGAALAALVVIVLIAYFIGRKKNRQGYESV